MILTLFLMFYGGLALLCFHLGWRGAQSDYRARGGFYLCVLVFIPLLLSFRWAQDTAESRLEAMGITPHPAIDEPSGLAVGLERSSPTWLFTLTEPGTEALGFYRDPSHLDGWKLSDDSANTLIFHRNGQRLLIFGSDQPTLGYMISGAAPGKGAPRDGRPNPD